MYTRSSLENASTVLAVFFWDHNFQGNICMKEIFQKIHGKFQVLIDMHDFGGKNVFICITSA